MEAAVVMNGRRPRIRPTAVRDGLNRYTMVAAVSTDEKKAATQLARLSVGAGVSTVGFPVSQTAMSGIAELLRLPVHLDWGFPKLGKDVDCGQLEPILKFVDALTVRPSIHPPAFWALIHRLVPLLDELECPSSLFNQLPPMNLQKLVLSDSPADRYDLSGHTIRRVDVSVNEFCGLFPCGAHLPPSIKALGLVDSSLEFDPSVFSIEECCRCFPGLEDLHIIFEDLRAKEDLVAHFKDLWAACLRLRDELDVRGLKRLFFTIKHDCTTLIVRLRFYSTTLPTASKS
ncbi:hypothetical protein M3Y99_00525800 [Aphelenchoides fujianensis]|nr:hypothetical protein M3Y99_00525800 [Aphelenchoides fujianensis]